MALEEESILGFVGYMGDKAGYLNPYYDKIVKEYMVEFELRKEEYQAKLRKMKASGKLDPKMKFLNTPTPPPKDYIELFKEYLQEHDLTLEDKLKIDIGDRRYILKIKKKDKIDINSLKSMSDGAIYLINGIYSKFKEEFIKNKDFRTLFIMHLFLGTQRIFICPYFDWRDDVYRHLNHQEAETKQINADLQRIVNSLVDNYEADPRKVKLYPACCKTRTDMPSHLGKNLHIGQAEKLATGKADFVDLGERHIKPLDLKFLEEVMSSANVNEYLPGKPLRFMVYNSYIVGGIGTYLVGTILSGTLKKGMEIEIFPLGIKSKVKFIEKDREILEEAKVPSSVAISVDGVKCTQMKRGMMITAWEEQENPRNTTKTEESEIENNPKKVNEKDEIIAHVRVTKI